MSIILLINLFILSIIITAFVNIRVSLALYIAYLILVPNLIIAIGGRVLTYNFVNIILLLGFFFFFFNKKKRTLNFFAITPFVFLYVSLLILSVFSEGAPWGWQLEAWRSEFIPIFVLTLIFWNLTLADHDTLKFVKVALLISILIAGVYGLFLTQMGGRNPYINFLSKYYNLRDDAEIFSELFEEARTGFSTAGKIQSTANHPMTWALICCFNLLTFVVFYFKDKKRITLFVIALVLVNIWVSGVRTALAASFLAAVYFIFRLGNLKLIFISLLVAFGLSVVILNSKELTNFFTSFVDTSGKKSDVGGSSITMRLEQLQGAFDEMEGHELAGKGFNWSSYYKGKHGEHPVLLAFESLLFVVLVNSGIVGILIWIVFFYLLFRSYRKVLRKKDNIYMMDSLLILFLSYCMGTGEYGYMRFFLIFYIFLLGIFIDQEGVWSNRLLRISKNYRNNKALRT